MTKLKRIDDLHYAVLSLHTQNGTYKESNNLDISHFLCSINLKSR